MKNDPRSNVYHWPIALCLALSAAVFAAPVMADVALPPPAQHQNAGFPSDQALQRRGYDPKTGIWKVDVQNNGKPTVNKDGGTYNGSQNKTVTVTGKYGETGTMNTTVNQKVEFGKLQKAANIIMIGNGIANGSNAASSYAAEVGRNIAQGNYGAAASNALQSVARFIDGLFGGPISGIVDLGSSFGDGYLEGKYQNIYKQAEQAQRQAEAEGNYQKAVANAAARKAAEAAQKAQQQDQQKKEEKKRDEEAKEKGLYAYDLIVKKIFQPNIYKSESSITYKSYKVYSNSPNYNVFSKAFITNGGFYHNYNPSKDYSFFTGLKNPSKISLEINNLPKESSIYFEIRSYPAGSPDIPNAAKNTGQVNPSDFMLTQKEILDILKRMLENQQTNHNELMNQLAKIGVVNQSAEQSTFSPDTALSAPYTPEGSSTPQQTRFKMNQNGTVGVDYVPRPDLKPNSPEAPNKHEKTTPSRQESPDTPNSPNTPNQPNNPTGQQNQNQENKQQNFCQQNPNAAQCMPSGESSYEDIKLPEQTIDLNFRPENIFQTDGVCPQPQSVDLGAFGRVEFSYQPLCDFAAKLRPVLIMMTILTCAWFVYGALEDL
ncbi:TspB protein [Neisseria flavescens]|nr:virulence factor TspB C-terminal domain-related protein [Neisseria flavescens]QCL69206.1 TspB protein [Neisseria flavescens]STZ64767.1 tspB protein [Neisseria flavescens]